MSLLRWRGRPVDDLSKEELIEALEEMCRQYERVLSQATGSLVVHPAINYDAPQDSASRGSNQLKYDVKNILDPKVSEEDLMDRLGLS